MRSGMLEFNTKVFAELGELFAGEAFSIVSQDLEQYSIPYEELLSQDLNYGFGFCVRDRKKFDLPRKEVFNCQNVFVSIYRGGQRSHVI